MKQHSKHLVMAVLMLPLFVVNAANPDKRYEKLVLKADRFYDHFIYPKAIENYEKALDKKTSFDPYASLQIANCYRLMNQPNSAENWYRKLEDQNIMTDQDYANYAQVLLENGKDEEAKRVLTFMKHEDLDIERLRAMDDRGQFFRDSLAYFVENMNINSENSDFAPTYFEEGIAFVSNRKTKKLLQSTYAWDDSYFLDLYFTQNTEEGNTRPEAFSTRLNTIFHEGPAVFYDNDNKVIFTRNNFNLGRTKTSVEGVNKLKLYYAERTGKKQKWSKSKPLPFNSDEYAVGHPTLSKDGKTLYFSSDMPGGQGEADLYRSSLVNGEWSAPENLGDRINTSVDELFPYISKDNVLYFASEGHSGIGGLDIYHIDLNEADSEVINMGYPINTRGDDFGMILEGKKGYFSSDRHGGKGGDDIYELTIYRFDLVVQLVDAVTREPLDGDLSVFAKGGEAISIVEGGSSTEFVTFRGRNYHIVGASEGYKPTSLEFATAGVNAGAESYILEVPLERPDVDGEIIVVRNYGFEDQLFAKADELLPFDGSLEGLKEKFKNDYVNLTAVHEIEAIYFDFDKSEVRSDAAEELEKLAAVMLENPEFQVTLTGHTDIRGSKSYNERLSRRRVEATQHYLLERGISQDRITTEYLGEQLAIENCQDCSESQHQLNRRTEIRLSKMEGQNLST